MLQADGGTIKEVLQTIYVFHQILYPAVNRYHLVAIIFLAWNMNQTSGDNILITKMLHAQYAQALLDLKSSWFLEGIDATLGGPSNIMAILVPTDLITPELRSMYVLITIHSTLMEENVELTGPCFIQSRINVELYSVHHIPAMKWSIVLFVQNKMKLL